MGSDFWERQRAKQQGQAAPVPVSQPEGAWWARGTQILEQRQTVAQQPLQSHTEPPEQGDPNKVGGHDVSKLGLLKGGAEECPVCPPNPDSGIRGNMYRPTPSAAMRCFDCGYIEGNRFLGETSGLIAVTEGPAHRARQTNSGGAVINNYRGNISSAKQAAGRLS